MNLRILETSHVLFIIRSYSPPCYIFSVIRYARLKSAIDEITAAVAAARDERRGVRGGGLGSGTSDERWDRDNKEKDKEYRKSSERDRSEHRYVYLMLNLILLLGSVK